MYASLLGKLGNTEWFPLGIDSGNFDFAGEKQYHLVETSVRDDILTPLGRIILYSQRILQDTISIIRVIIAPISLGRKYENLTGQQFQKNISPQHHPGNFKHYRKKTSMDFKSDP